jgi:16S rRNA (cytidine1402-2'-O)-methyltransferase
LFPSLAKKDYNVFTATGALYIVATPLGNLGDISRRALDVLAEVDLIAAEDTRNSLKLLTHFGIKKAMMALHEHNEREQADEIITKLRAGQSIALISDAGTHLISDPGYNLVSRLHDEGLRVVPIPGPSALITALSVSGLPTDHFCFEGFLPSKTVAREKTLTNLLQEHRTMVFYEAPHRLVASLLSIRDILGSERLVTLVREVTKLHETIRRDTAASLLDWVEADPEQQMGESVLVVEGAARKSDTTEVEIRVHDLLSALLNKLSVKDAAQLAAELTGLKKNSLYEQALAIQRCKPAE